MSQEEVEGEVEEVDYHFQKLTPNKKYKLKIYEDALNFVFENDELKNVAVSGPYSAGKSSLIETYKIKYPKKKYLHISLAHFESPEVNPVPEVNPAPEIKPASSIYNEAVLEGKIINQLIHQIDADKIPKTNFKVKQKISVKGTRQSTVFISTIVILLFYMMFFKSWSSFVPLLKVDWLRDILMWTTIPELLLVSGIISIMLFGFTTYYIITTQKNKNIFKRLNLQGNEIEIFQETNESYFDKYLNEVLYLFENSEADAIIFEDIDRHNVNQIFEKLKEINTLINNKKMKEKKAPIRFIYLLRDDIFISKDRTKFFDFIIPVVPVIDGSNSYDQFIEHFKLGGIYNLFDEGFLKGLSLYIDDMRILKNIYNEFVIYNNLIQSIELNNNKLLAIIAYKNIFPRDFSELQLGRGYVHTIFENKLSFIEQELIEIDNDINKIEENIRLTEVEILGSIHELDAVYILPKYTITSAGGRPISHYNTTGDLVVAIKGYNYDVQIYTGYTNTTINIKDDFEKLHLIPEYIERKEAIERKSGNAIENLKVQIQTLMRQKSEIQNTRLQKIITKENIGNIFSISFLNEIGEENKFEEIKGSPYFPLIKYLLRNGYIDETYSDYMTYFYENSLSIGDKNFLLSITDKSSKSYSHPLKNPKLVLSRLRPLDFEQIEILNFDLLCYLLSTQDINRIFLKKFLQQLRRTKNFKFIDEFLGTERETSFFIEALNKTWPRIFDEIINESDYSNEQKKQYATYTLYNSDLDDIIAVDENQSLNIFVSECPNFLDTINPNIDLMIKRLSELGVKFTNIDYDVSNKELFAEVYKKDLYELTFEHIELILVEIYGLEKNSDFFHKNYTLIRSNEDEPLLDYVNRNISSYINTILDKSDEYISDDEYALLAILNNFNINTDDKREYISYLQTKLSRIDRVTYRELWKNLLQEEVVTYVERNIIDYFVSNEEIDTYLINFINSSSQTLIFNDSMMADFDDDTVTEFFEAIVKCKELSNERYESILESFNKCFNSYPFDELDIESEKVLILIKIKIISMTESILISLRENYPETVMYYITTNLSEYLEIINHNLEKFDLEEMLSLLNENIGDEYKIKLLENTEEKLPISHKGYSNLVKQHILTYNFTESDIEFLISSYSTESVDIQKLIFEITINNVRDILENQYSVDFKLLLELLSSSELDMDTKKELLLLSLPDLKESQARECLTILNMNDFLSLFEQKRPKIKVNAMNKRFLTIFEARQWVTRFEIDKVDQESFRAYGRKLR